MADLDHPVDPPEGWQAEHIKRYVATDGQDGHEWQPGVTTLLLTTVGQRSGLARRTPLIYRRDGDRYVVVASKGGADEHPLWFRNLTAEPRARVQVLGDRIDVTARVADGEERARLWSMMAEIWPAYDEYQTKTEREIPIVVLEPIPDN
jgi:deazaflavin-dependent oxidoreductase (nitroreductase family)